MAVKETAIAVAAGASAPVVVEVAKNTLVEENTSSSTNTSSSSTNTVQDSNNSQDDAVSSVNFQGVVTGPVSGFDQASVQQVPESPITMLAIGLAIGAVGLMKVLKKKSVTKADIKKI